MSCTRRRSASDILASSGIVVIGWAEVDAGGGDARPAGTEVGVGAVVIVEVGSGVGESVGVEVAVGVEVGSGVGENVGVEVAVGVEAGSGVGVGVGVEVAVGVEVGPGVGVGVGTTDRPQPSIREPIRRRKNARKQVPRFRSIENKSIRSVKATLGKKPR